MEVIGMQGEMNTGRTRAPDGCVYVPDGERRRLLAGMVLLCCPAVVHAVEWSVDPAVSAALGYESNAALTTGPHETVSEEIIIPGLAIRRLTETSAVDVGLLGRGTYYSGNQFEDTHEASVTLSSFVQTTERTKLALDAVSRWDSLFESAVLGSGVGNIQDVDIGLVTTKVRREWREAAPSVTYALTERSSVVLFYRLTDVKFGNVGTTGLVDYRQDYLSGTYSYRLTPTNDLDAVVRTARYRPVTGIDSDTTGLLAGLSHRFSPTADAGFHAGAGKTTETMSDGSQVDTSSFVLEARAAQQSEISRLDALISRDVQPSGSGQSVLTDQLRIDWNRRLAPTVALRLRTTAFRNRALKGSDPLVDRRYAEAGAGVAWYWRPEWAVGIDYQYRYQRYDASLDAAGSSGVFVAVTWAQPRQH